VGSKISGQIFMMNCRVAEIIHQIAPHSSNIGWQGVRDLKVVKLLVSFFVGNIRAYVVR
jgi:hypothetical protein